MARRSDGAKPDDRVPGFADVCEIGVGAVATVYRALEVETGRPVALKVLKADAVHPHLIETFQREVHALAKVSDHPNIVTFYRPLTTLDGRPVLVLELCQESLAERLRRGGPLGARDVTRVGVKIGGALETAHRAGFLHRELKPQNVLVTQFGEPALGDFGVAALHASAHVPGGAIGFTAHHSAPEILEGNDLSPATDIYGLASTLYQAVTGTAPFAPFDNEAPASVILRIIRDPVRPIHAEDVPLALSDLLEAALAKEPSDRPPNATAFADALIAVERANGWPATSYSAWGRPRPPAPHETAAPVVPPAPPPVAPPPPRPGPALYPSAPSVQVAAVSPRRPMAPIDIGPAATGASPQPPPEVVAPPGPLTKPPTPPAPASQGGRGVARPDQVARHVVVPDQSGRGQENRPLRANRNLDWPPLQAQPGVARPSDRPLFLNPPSSDETPPSPESARDSIYEQTLVHPLAPAAPTGRSLQAVMMATTLGLAVAVVILGILLVVGVL